MKPKEILYNLGFRPPPRMYGYEVVEIDFAVEGKIEYARWLHPLQREMQIDQSVVNELRRFLNPGDVAIDIGAHTGDSTIPLALAVGPSGTVLALEPNKYVFPVLEKNASLNRQTTNIIPLPFAATPADGEFEFEYSDAGFCNGGRHVGISKWRHGHAFELIVEGRNLHSFLLREYAKLIDRIKLIKVDAEGYDHEILASLEELVCEKRPFIKAEIFKHSDESQRKRFYEFFFDLGYKIYGVESDAKLTGTELGSDDVLHQEAYDIFCMPGQGAPR